jgi:hypothetical protein
MSNQDRFEELVKRSYELCRALKQLEDSCREAADALRKLQGLEAAPPAQTLSGNAPIASAEQVLTHGPDDHRVDHNCER